MSRVPVRNANLNNTDFTKNCPTTPTCTATKKYREFDGSCNNLVVPKFGMAKTTLGRVLVNAYDDGDYLFPLIIKEVTNL